MNAITFYDKNAAQYNLPEHEDFYGRIAQELLKVIPTDFAPESILEVGSGTGFATAQLRESYPQAVITGLEPSPGMLAKAREKFPDVTWHPKSLNDFAAWEHFDLIFSSMAAHWLTSKEWQALFDIPAKCLALALPAISDSADNNPANMLLKKLVFKLKAKPNWPKKARHLNMLTQQVKADNFSFKEQFEDHRQLAESLYTRGVLVSLFGNKAEEAKELLQKDLNSACFSWSFKLITTAGHSRNN